MPDTKLTPLIDMLTQKARDIETCNPLALPDTVRRFAQTAMSVIRDHENRLAALERESTARRAIDVVM
jgi:hypothetical protein